ncbi:hypothetical protein FRB96_009521 [Tulasnella sp. 330]|nr:hypothetical protein FRB96_009521 [Tulasnella sp. 330]KAG8875383.1 hypothetical protein FRB97_005172 [Tulasnella sp. 331]KAG8876348.1 hypothetical protein FRB98_007335 [Tulasnella sp. 332]
MSQHVNVIADYDAAPVTPAGLPTHAGNMNNKGHDGLQQVGLDDEYDEKKGLDSHTDVKPGHDYDYVTPDGEQPTEWEISTLKKVPAAMAWPAIAMCLIEFAERASYYGSTGPFNNFVNNPLPVGGSGSGAVPKGPAGLNEKAGALGLGSQAATAITTSFTFLAYTIPIFGGIVADTKWGRFKTICVGTAVGAAPRDALVRTNKKGEREIVDPQTTIQRYFLIFYWAINIGAFFALATSYAERDVGFWLAYLLPGILYMLMPIVLVMCYKKLYKAPPQGSVLVEAFQVCRYAFKYGGFSAMFKRNGPSFWDVAKPSNIAAREGSVDTSKVFWDDLFVDEIKQSLQACTIFLLIPIFSLADGGLGNSENDMSDAMVTGNTPNDLMTNFNSLTIVVFTPILTWGLYPLFAKWGYPIKPMTRMSIGFVLGGLNMIIGAIVQWKVYKTSPCGYYATTCADVSTVSLWWQIPLNALPAIGELFVNVTSYEIAYTHAPARMKGLVYGLNLFNSAIASAISLALTAVVVDPFLIWSYVAIAIACFICAALFPTVFKHFNEPVALGSVDRMEGREQPKAIQAPREKS